MTLIPKPRQIFAKAAPILPVPTTPATPLWKLRPKSPLKEKSLFLTFPTSIRIVFVFFITTYQIKVYTFFI